MTAHPPSCSSPKPGRRSSARPPHLHIRPTKIRANPSVRVPLSPAALHTASTVSCPESVWSSGTDPQSHPRSPKIIHTSPEGPPSRPLGQGLNFVLSPNSLSGPLLPPFVVPHSPSISQGLSMSLGSLLSPPGTSCPDVAVVWPVWSNTGSPTCVSW